MNNFIQTLSERKGELLEAAFQHLSISLISLLIAALIAENKDFDSLIFPNSAHAVARFPYVIRKKWDYFVRHLLGQQPPEGFDLTPPKE